MKNIGKRRRHSFYPVCTTSSGLKSNRKLLAGGRRQLGARADRLFSQRISFGDAVDLRNLENYSRGPISNGDSAYAPFSSDQFGSALEER